MTVEQAWVALDAAGRLAEAYGVELEPTIRPHALRLAFWRRHHTGSKLFGVLSISEAALKEADDATGICALIEHEVAAFLAAKRGAPVS